MSSKTLDPDESSGSMEEPKAKREKLDVLNERNRNEGSSKVLNKEGPKQKDKVKICKAFRFFCSGKTKPFPPNFCYSRLQFAFYA